MTSQRKNTTIYLILPILSGICWGTAGLFVRTLDDAGLDNVTITFSKILVAAVIMFISILVTDPKGFRIDWKDLPVLSGIGVAGSLVLSMTYNEAVLRTSLSLAAVLLCLAPIFVLIFGAILFGEKLTRGKLLCACLAIFGSILLSGLLDDGGTLPWDTIGFLFGLSSAVANAAYTILSKMAVNKGYGSMTIYFYSYLLVLVALIPFTDFEVMTGYLLTSPGEATAIYLGHSIWTSILPGVLYTIAVRHADAGKVATVAAGAEPAASMVLGIILYYEIPSLLGVAGMALTIWALVKLIRLDQKETQ